MEVDGAIREAMETGITDIYKATCLIHKEVEMTAKVVANHMFSTGQMIT